MNIYNHKKYFSFALITFFLSNIVYSLPINAQLTNTSSSINFTPPAPPPERGAAGDRGSAASRGCGKGTESLRT